MQKSLYTLLFLLTAAAAGAQQMPERSLVRKGNRQYAKGNYEESIRRYEQALEAVPGQFEATYDLGNALYKAERFDRAEQTLRQAAADTLRPETELAEAYYNLGNAQFKQQKYKEALESYKQSLRLNPSDMEAKYNYAYTKRLLQKQQNEDQNKDQNKDQQNSGGQDQNQDKNKDNNSDKDRQQDKGGEQQDQQDRQNGQNDPDKNGQNPDEQPQDSDKPDSDDRQPGQPRENGISLEEQERMLDAIQAQEDKTQEKLKEKAGVAVRGNKNW